MTDPKLKSWSINDWPEDVWPNTKGRARRVLRLHRKDLMSCGALARVGRELIVFADAYNRWLRSKAKNVDGYKIKMNERRDSANA